MLINMPVSPSKESVCPVGYSLVPNKETYEWNTSSFSKTWRQNQPLHTLPQKPNQQQQQNPYMLSANILPVTFLKRALVSWSIRGVCVEEQLENREITFIYATCHASTPPGHSMSSFLSLDLIREFASYRVLTPYRASWVTRCPLTLWMWATHVCSLQPQSCLPDWRAHGAPPFSLPGKLVNWAYIVY